MCTLGAWYLLGLIYFISQLYADDDDDVCVNSDVISTVLMLDGENAQKHCEDIHFETQHTDGSRKLESDNWAGTQPLKRTCSIDEDRTNCQSGR